MNLLEMGLSAAAIIVLVVLVRAVGLHALPKKLFLALWGLVCLRLLVPYSIPSQLSVFNLLRLGAAQGAAGSLAGEADVAAGALSGPVSSGTGFALPWLWMLWGAGTLVCIVCFVALYRRGRARFAGSLPATSDCVRDWQEEHPLKRPVQVRISDRVDTPLTYGVLRPVILLPKGLEDAKEAQLRTVLMHEWVHIKHWDALKKLVLAVALCLHWWNPLVWVMYLLAGRDIELACDESVVRALGLDGKTAYAMTLLDMEAQKGGPAILANHFSKYAIEERIGTIMKMKKRSMAAIVGSVVLVAGLALAFGTSASAAGLGAEARTATSAETQEYEQAVRDWKTFGVTYNDLTGRVYYKGTLVRFFVDDRGGAFGGFSGSVWDMEDGEYHLVTRRDNSGNLVGIDEITAEEATKIAHWRG